MSTPKLFIPIAASLGDNVATKSANMPWYAGPTVLDALDRFPGAEPSQQSAAAIPDPGRYRFDHRRILAGRVESGTLEVGDKILFSPRNKISTVKSIERWTAGLARGRGAGESIGITLTEQIFVERGQIGSQEKTRPLRPTCSTRNFSGSDART